MTRLAAALLALGLAALPARANDSTAEVGVGGLTLVKSDAIVMQSEDLFVSEKKITVDYVFLNTSGADIETLVAFPLPDVVYEPEMRVPDFLEELDFRTTVDGRPLKLDIVQQAVVNGRDVSDRVKAAGFRLLADWESFNAAVEKKTPAEREALLAEGLLRNDGDEQYPYWLAGWVTKTTVTRTQVFPAGRPIRVSHAYTPLAGGSVGSILKPSLRKDPALAKEIAALRAKYCIDDDFVRGFDATQGKNPELLRPEIWVSYVLTSGANWKGPIGRFRLVVDKGDVKNLVSFCATGVKKIAPTRFEVVYDDFTPKQDLNVLIVRPPQAY
ncbi:DUF4424 family protein [Pinisolibacter sp.]|uniref:DUF4424 family protein n=1 Tax=Pinisolibacter sp. TaxID=2172024 RepID=UPI002FDD8EBF